MFHMVVSPETISTVPDTYECSVGDTTNRNKVGMAVQFHQGKSQGNTDYQSERVTRGETGSICQVCNNIGIGNHQNPK